MGRMKKKQGGQNVKLAYMSKKNSRKGEQVEW